ncbi:hypothetical protein I315_04175 [Cryptococcus gattii Ru294]|nr:hypothetical protein I315_04175 [Cryptococcus gattii Ru294]
MYSTLIAEKRPQFCKEHVIPYFTAVGISCKGLSSSAIVGRIADLQRLFQDADALQKPNQHTGKVWLKKILQRALTLGILLQQAIGNKEAEELGEPLFMTINCLMNEDISTADERGDCVEDEASQGAQGQRQVRRNEAFHKVQDNIIQMMLEVNANDQKGRMEFAAFQAEAETTARAEEREAESARYSAEAALRNVEAKRVEEEHQICMAKRKREEEAAEEERNIKRTTAIQARTMWLVEFAKKDVVEAEKQAERENNKEEVRERETNKQDGEVVSEDRGEEEDGRKRRRTVRGGVREEREPRERMRKLSQLEELRKIYKE